MFGAQAASPFGAPSTGGLFGAPAASAAASPFGAPASGSLFGAAPASSPFGAAPGGSLFGTPASSGASLFGAASSGGLFGAASSGGLFGAASSGGLFGAASSGGLFGAASSGGLFGAASSGSLFGGSTAGAHVPAATGGMFGGAGGGLFGGQQQQPQQQVMQQQQQQLQTGRDGQPIGSRTSFEQLPDNIQQFLKQVQQKVVQARNDASSLQACMASPELTSEHRAMSEEADALMRELLTVRAALEADCAAADSFRGKVITLTQGTEHAAWLLRVNNARRQVAAAQGQQAQQQLMSENAALLSHATQVPSPFLGIAVDSFQEQLVLLRSTLASLEALVPLDGPVKAPSTEALDALPDVMRTMHEYFIHVAAGVARLEKRAASLRQLYLAARADQGDYYDPFADADRREGAKAEAMARPAQAMASGGGPVSSKVALPGGFGPPSGGGTPGAPQVPLALPANPAGGQAGGDARSPGVKVRRR